MTKETVRCRCVCKVDSSFPLSPAGILKIIEMALGIVQIILVAVGRNAYNHIVNMDKAIAISADTNASYESANKYLLASAIIVWLLTILFFLLFLFCIPEMAGGPQVWNILDTIFIVIWVMMYVVHFIIICIVCGAPEDHSGRYSDELIAGIAFSLLLLVAYILSLVFGITAAKAKTLY